VGNERNGIQEPKLPVRTTCNRDRRGIIAKCILETANVGGLELSGYEDALEVSLYKL
jgi:hypothetical protein